MASSEALNIRYSEIYSRLFSKIEAYDFIKLPEDTVNDFLCNWIHSASANPYVRKLFSSFELDDLIQTITCTMSHAADTLFDREFVIEILSLGMIVCWLEPKVNSMKYIAQKFSSKDAKYYSQAAHLAEIEGLLNNTRDLQRKTIRDRGYVWNTYLDGE